MGEKRGALHMCIKTWSHYVKEMKEYNKGHALKDDQIAALEKKVEAMINKNQLKLAKYSEMLAGKNTNVIKGLVFNGFKDHTKNVKDEMETERERAVQLQELHRQQEMALAIKK